jgi:flagellar M-ring protein FliF
MENFKSWFSKTFTGVKEKWTALSARTRVIALAVAGVVIASAVIITVVLNRPEQTVLVTAGSAQEATQIVSALAEVQIDAAVTRDNEIIVADNALMDARRALSERGLPRPSQNNDIWNSGVGMFSTDTQMREYERHQLQDWIRSYLSSIPEVEDSRVILSVPHTPSFVMVENKMEPRAAVSVSLRTGQTLSNDQVKGIYAFVQNSVPGLQERDITLTDGSSIPLIPSDGDGNIGEALALQQQKYAMEVGLKSLIAENARAQLVPLLERVVGPENYELSVNATLDFSSDRTIEEVEFTPVVGLDSGIVRDVLRQYAGGYTAETGQEIGTFNNSDIAPDYPTLSDIQAGSEVFLEWQERINYEINERRTFFNDNGLRISAVTASLVINSEAVPPAEADMWRELVANGTGAAFDNVTFMARPFPLPLPDPTPPPRLPGDTMRNVLIYIIIALGVLLVVLFILAILTSGKKKRQVRYRGAIPGMDAMGGYLRDDSFQPVLTEADDFDLPSLLDENETKDVVLKREIREFSKSNPEIIAQLIRTWFRDDEP